MDFKCKVSCVICKKPLDNLDDGGNQPSDGTEFYTRGHYGSAVSDFMDGTGLVVNICDPCLRAAKEEKLVLIVKPRKRPRPVYQVWEKR